MPKATCQKWGCRCVASVSHVLQVPEWEPLNQRERGLRLVCSYLQCPQMLRVRVTAEWPCRDLAPLSWGPITEPLPGENMELSHGSPSGFIPGENWLGKAARAGGHEEASRSSLWFSAGLMSGSPRPGGWLPTSLPPGSRGPGRGAGSACRRSPSRKVQGARTTSGSLWCLPLEDSLPTTTHFSLIPSSQTRCHPHGGYAVGSKAS